MNEHAVSFQNLNNTYHARQSHYEGWAIDAKLNKKREASSTLNVLGILLLIVGAFLLGLFWEKLDKQILEREGESAVGEEGDSLMAGCEDLLNPIDVVEG